MPGDSDPQQRPAGSTPGSASAPEPPPGGRAPHVLIAEDEVHIARMLGTLLEEASMRVTVTTDGASALEFIRSDPTIELVILDLMMPEMSGLDVLRETRRRTEELPVIVLTAKGESDVRDEALTLGATELFIKPFSPRKLVSRVRELCGP